MKGPGTKPSQTPLLVGRGYPQNMPKRCASKASCVFFQLDVRCCISRLRLDLLFTKWAHCPDFLLFLSIFVRQQIPFGHKLRIKIYGKRSVDASTFFIKRPQQVESHLRLKFAACMSIVEGKPQIKPRFRQYGRFRNYCSETTVQQLRFRNYCSETTVQTYDSETSHGSETTVQTFSSPSCNPCFQ